MKTNDTIIANYRRKKDFLHYTLKVELAVPNSNSSGLFIYQRQKNDFCLAVLRKMRIFASEE